MISFGKGQPQTCSVFGSLRRAWSNIYGQVLRTGNRRMPAASRAFSNPILLGIQGRRTGGAGDTTQFAGHRHPSRRCAGGQPEPVATVSPCVRVCVCVCTHAGIVPVRQSCSSGGCDAERPRLGLLCSTEGIPRSSGALILPSRLLLKIGLLLPLHPRL